jgi:predicted amidohydrolase
MTSPFRIAAAQSQSVAHDLVANVAIHQSFVHAAGGVDLLVFPELSLVGYELDTVSHVAVTASDPRLEPLQSAARATGTTIVAGALLAGDDPRPTIGSIVFFPSGDRSTHTKQHLHPGEERFVMPGAGSGGFHLGPRRIALAICADTNTPAHAAAAADAGASIYACSMLVSEAGYAVDTAQLQHYAARHAYTVLMANHGGATGGWLGAGRSAIWAPGGALICAAPGAGNMLVTAAWDGEQWRGEVREASI